MSDTVYSRLTVLFEDPFWVGIYEREEDGFVTVCKVTFGAEPKDGEVYEAFLANWHRLHFSPPVESTRIEKRQQNFKKIRRQIQKQLQQKSIGTKAQQALKAQQEMQKNARKTTSREQKAAALDRKFSLRQQKRREKYKGH